MAVIIYNKVLTERHDRIYEVKPMPSWMITSPTKFILISQFDCKKHNTMNVVIQLDKKNAVNLSSFYKILTECILELLFLKLING